MVSNQKIIFVTLVIFISLCAVIKISGSSKNLLDVSVMNCLPKQRKVQLRSVQKDVTCPTTKDDIGDIVITISAKGICSNHCVSRARNIIIQLNETFTNLFVLLSKTFPEEKISEKIIVKFKYEFGSRCVKPKENSTKQFWCLCKIQFDMYGSPSVQLLIQKLLNYIRSEEMKNFEPITFIEEVRNHKQLKNCIMGLDDKNQLKKSNRSSQQQTKRNNAQPAVQKIKNLKSRIAQFSLFIGFALMVFLMYVPIRSLPPNLLSCVLGQAAFIIKFWDIYVKN